MWLTRNICEKICRSLASTLEKTMIENVDRESNSPVDTVKLLATEHQLAINEIPRNKVETIPDSIKTQQSSPVKLCSSVNISL